MANKMTNEQIIQLAEHFGIYMMSRKMVLTDNKDGTDTISFERELHYAGEQIIELVRLMEGVKND